MDVPRDLRDVFAGVKLWCSIPADQIRFRQQNACSDL